MDWLFDRLIDWLLDWLIDWLLVELIVLWRERLVGRFVGWMIAVPSQPQPPSFQTPYHTCLFWNFLSYLLLPFNFPDRIFAFLCILENLSPSGDPLAALNGKTRRRHIGGLCGEGVGGGDVHCLLLVFFIVVWWSINMQLMVGRWPDRSQLFAMLIDCVSCN